MKIYNIRNWSDHYENNRTKELKHMSWIPIPNNHDGDGYTQVMAEKNGLELFGAWIVIVQTASKCGNTAGTRGALIRGNGKPHDAASISRISRAPENKIQAALDYFSTALDWLIIRFKDEIPQEGAAISHEDAVIPPEPALKEGKEQKEYTAEALELTGELIALMRRNDPKARIPDSLDSWHSSAELLLGKDGRELNECVSVLRGALNDNFWRANILSMPKFREKFTGLRAKFLPPAMSNPITNPTGAFAD